MNGRFSPGVRFALIPFLLLSLAWALSPFDRKFTNSSAVFTGKIQSAGFEQKTADVPIQKYFAEIKAERVFKGPVTPGQVVRVLVGGKTLYHGKLHQVGDTDLPAGLRAVFYLGFLFPDEREFSSGAEYYLDLAVPVMADSVYARFAPSPANSLENFEDLLKSAAGRYAASEIFRGSQLVVSARIREAAFSRAGGARVSIELDSAIALKGRLDSAHVFCAFPDHFRRIHFRNRNRDDIPFYISRNAEAQRLEEQRNFFLSSGQRVIVCLNQTGSGLIVHLGAMGIYFLDHQDLLSNRYSLPHPRPLAHLVLP